MWWVHPVYHKYASNELGEILNIFTGMKMKQKKGRYAGFLMSWNGDERNLLSHRFVWECLNQKLIPEGMVIDHINTDCRDNRIENLKLCTMVENYHNPLTEERHRAGIESRKRPVELYNTETGYVKARFKCIADAERSGICSRSRIMKQLAGGPSGSIFRWRYQT